MYFIDIYIYIYIDKKIKVFLQECIRSVNHFTLKLYLFWLICLTSSQSAEHVLNLIPHFNIQLHTAGVFVRWPIWRHPRCHAWWHYLEALRGVGRSRRIRPTQVWLWEGHLLLVCWQYQGPFVEKKSRKFWWTRTRIRPHHWQRWEVNRLTGSKLYSFNKAL